MRLRRLGVLQLEFGMQELCMDLLRADTEEEVISILRQQGYWDDPAVWVPFGGREDNFSTIGNQSGNAEAALVEKLINSVDAVLMGECLLAGIRPNSTEAPKSITEAVAQFFFGDRTKAESLGQISMWDDRKRLELSRRITLAATGTPQSPSLTVVDAGEGQTPNSMPDTLLSLDKQNKVDVQFVQGKFNMGGTGALRFSGQHNLQLVISRRNPKVTELFPFDDSRDQWGFTVVRRENPIPPKRVSTYTYLAPESKSVLRFSADTLRLFPQGNKAYARETAWGTAIKLYEYHLTGRSHILLRRGLRQRLDLQLPRIALPVRLHECRAYSGNAGSFDTTLTGLSVRLNDDHNENLEPDFPTSITSTIRGEPLTGQVYAFKRGKADNYKRSEGIIFSVNGQTHGILSQSFFSRTAVGLNRLEDSILVILDCSQISGRNREDLFMNSRDRMEQGQFLRDIENELQSALKDNSALRALRELRRREDVESKLQDSKPFREVLESIFRKSPTMAAMFGGTGPLPNPFRSTTSNNGKPFVGKAHPSFFRFQHLQYGRELKRTTAINMRSRIPFTTDVVNNYFDRSQYAGKRHLRLLDDRSGTGYTPDNTLNLHNGVATLNLALPSGACVGDSFTYELAIQDETLVDSFVNRFEITVGPRQEPSGKPRPRPKHSENNGGHDPALNGLAIPFPIEVYQLEWEKYGFDKNSALKVVYDPPEDDGNVSGSYTYYINMDNIYLQTELKATKDSLAIVKSRWKFGMVLVGMALLRDRAALTSSGTTDEEVAGGSGITAEVAVGKVTAAMAPVLLPLIEHLGALSGDDVPQDDPK